MPHHLLLLPVVLLVLADLPVEDVGLQAHITSVPVAEETRGLVVSNSAEVCVDARSNGSSCPSHRKRRKPEKEKEKEQDVQEEEEEQEEQKQEKKRHVEEEEQEEEEEEEEEAQERDRSFKRRICLS